MLLGFFIGIVVASAGWLVAHRWQLARIDLDIEARKDALDAERVRRILDRGSDERDAEWVAAKTPVPE